MFLLQQFVVSQPHAFSLNSLLLSFQLFHHLSLTLVFMVLVSFSTAEQGVPSAKTDALALINFKKIIQNDPNGVLSSWQLSYNKRERPSIILSGTSLAKQDLPGRQGL